jgi:hypothetical protein
MDINYCVLVFIVHMSSSDTQRVAKCCLHEKNSMFKIKGGRSCPQVPVITNNNS